MVGGIVISAAVLEASDAMSEAAFKQRRMIPQSCKRLTEVDFPIAEVSKHAARLDWKEGKKAAHYCLAVNAMPKSIQVRKDTSPYGGES
jgi:hypothetical protein